MAESNGGYDILNLLPGSKAKAKEVIEKRKGKKGLPKVQEVEAPPQKAQDDNWHSIFNDRLFHPV